jgi:hypothetical protein
MVKINRYFNDYFNKFQHQKIWNCRDGHGQIWIDHFDHENFVIVGIVMVKFGLTIFNVKPQFGQVVK